jgi:type IV pilus assembly protein PilC
MARFVYTAEKNGGEVYKGVADAADRFEVYQIIRREGGRLLWLGEDAMARRFFSLAYWNAQFSTVSEQDKIMFARNLGSMLGAGLPLSRALAVITRQMKNVRLNATLSEVASDIRHGDSLHVALAKFPRVFPKIMTAMVRAGEEGGDLSASLTTTSEQMERANDLKKKVRGALLYPSIILVAIVGIGALMMIEVVPTLASTFKEMHATLPFATRVIIGISDFLVEYTVLALALVVGTGVAIYLGARTRQGGRFLDYCFLHLPLIGAMVREVNAARTARTIASLVSAGVDVLMALEITQEVVQNSYFQDVLAKARENVGLGQQLSATFIAHEDLYPPFVGEMMAVGEETGQTAEMLKRLALFFEAEVDRKTKNMSTIIEPFLMIFIGAVVGFFAVSMIMPIYQLSENI